MRTRGIDARPSGTRLASLAFAGLGIGTLTIVALHAIEPRVDPLRHYISEYGNADRAALFSFGLVFLAAGLAALGAGLRASTGARTGPGLLVGAGGCLALAAAFSTDRVGGEVIAGSSAGNIHGYASIAGFCLIALAMPALRAPLERSGRLVRISRLAVPLAAMAVAWAALTYLTVPGAPGARQRGFVAVVFVWLLALSLRLRKLSSAPDRRLAPES